MTKKIKLRAPRVDHVKGGYRVMGHGGGGKGGGEAHQPEESPDSLHSVAYARVIDLISEGPIVGPVHGPSGILQDIYLDSTPIQNANGEYNFNGVAVDFRAGTQDQDYIPGFPAAEATVAVGVALREDTPWTQLITDTTLSAVRVTLGATLVQIQDNGDQTGYLVHYVIELSSSGGPFQTVIDTTFDGKTTQVYERTHRIDLPAGQTSWTIRVRRTTPNADSTRITDTTTVQSYTTVVDAKLRMPMSACVGVQVDAAQFQSIPGRAFHFRGRIISVPSNYDPETGNYSGVWDGTFKQAYSNNPAWVFYDISTNSRYGAGERLSAAALSNLKWALYPISQYCDEQVPDGLGGNERRFTCNVYIQTAADAAKVLSDLASVFMGMVYEANGAILASADMPSDFTYTFTNSNVVDGKFARVGSPWRQRPTVAQVSYNDMTNFGIQKIEPVQDDEGIARLGVRITKISAFGCTSRAQAIRAGKWALLTSRIETQAISFDVGLDQALVNPGSIIRVSDQWRAGRRVGGRISEVTNASTIVVDLTTIVRPGDRLVVNLPNGVAESRVVATSVGRGLTADSTEWTADSTELTADMVGLPGSVLTITVTQPFSVLPEPEAVWTIESEELTNELYRVISVTRKDGITATIQATQHNPSKYDNIDFGTKIQAPPVTVVPPGIQPAPASVTLTSFSAIVQGIAIHNAHIVWPRTDSAVEYQVQWRRDNSDWIEAGRTGSTSLDIQNIRQGSYVARVRAINAAGIPSIWTTSTATQLDGDVAPPAALTTLTASTDQIFSVIVDWGFPTAPNIIERTEIWYAQINDLNSAVKLGDFAYPQNTHTLMGLSAGATFYFWGRLVDKNGETGPWYPLVNGVQGRASSDATAILEYLTNQITETQLSQALLQKIEDGSGQEALVQVQAITTQLAAMYTIKTQLTVGGVPYMAGIGVGVENNQGVITSQILLAAARVAILDESSGSTKAPFVVQGGQVFINQALIGTGWITNAMIGNVIQSDNFVSGSVGWQINKAGSVEINGNFGGSGRLTISNQLIRIYDGSGLERVRLGIW